MDRKRTDSTAVGSKLKLTAILTILLVLPLAVVVQALSPVIGTSKLQRLEIGMSKEEVAEVLGQPSRERTSERAWEYEHFLNPGWVDIYFDSSGRMSGINDESVIRTTR